MHENQAQEKGKPEYFSRKLRIICRCLQQRTDSNLGICLADPLMPVVQVVLLHPHGRLPCTGRLIFRAILMNVKALLKYFPEIHHLPQESQLRLLQSAHDEAFGPHNKLQIWRSNLTGFGLLILVCTLVIAFIGPILDLQRSTTAILLMLIVFPGFMAIQQRRYLVRLRPLVNERLRQLDNSQA